MIISLSSFAIPYPYLWKSFTEMKINCHRFHMTLLLPMGISVYQIAIGCFKCDPLNYTNIQARLINIVLLKKYIILHAYSVDVKLTCSESLTSLKFQVALLHRYDVLFHKQTW